MDEMKRHFCCHRAAFHSRLGADGLSTKRCRRPFSRDSVILLLQGATHSGSLPQGKAASYTHHSRPEEKDGDDKVEQGCDPFQPHQARGGRRPRCRSMSGAGSCSDTPLPAAILISRCAWRRARAYETSAAIRTITRLLRARCSGHQHLVAPSCGRRAWHSRPPSLRDAVSSWCG
ncbi:hypothetical protein HPB50_002119 [Hyalomma asiaticum]|uniref:Uncharacterized protein n=1 Tax=Hyalomma asiaticum TaxID=266040 RepID=A0ACB7TDE7_HYAAI|nr:hypothetical protein HPB50_002119 [Hyalomma asiaticum]